MTEHHLEFLSLKEAAQARLSLHLSKCHIIGNHMSRLKCVWGSVSLQQLHLYGHKQQKASLTITDNNRKVIILIVDDSCSSTAFPEKTIIRRPVVTGHSRIQKVLQFGPTLTLFFS